MKKIVVYLNGSEVNDIIAEEEVELVFVQRECEHAELEDVHQVDDVPAEVTKRNAYVSKDTVQKIISQF